MVPKLYTILRAVARYAPMAIPVLLALARAIPKRLIPLLAFTALGFLALGLFSWVQDLQGRLDACHSALQHQAGYFDVQSNHSNDTRALSERLRDVPLGN